MQLFLFGEIFKFSNGELERSFILIDLINVLKACKGSKQDYRVRCAELVARFSLGPLMESIMEIQKKDRLKNTEKENYIFENFSHPFDKLILVFPDFCRHRYFSILFVQKKISPKKAY